MVDDPLPWLLAARDDEGLRAGAQALRERVASTPQEGLADLAAATATAVPPLPQRAVVLARDRDRALRELDALARGGGGGAAVVRGRAREGAHTAFVFSPLRSEYAGMGLDLLDRHDAFAAAMVACEEALEPLLGWSLRDVLRGREGTPPFERLDVSQPVLFAMSYALAELWRSFGVEAGAVIGHSVGEIAAAAACHGLSLADAARVAATWGRSSMRLEGSGTMASLPLPAAEVKRRLARWDGRISISGLNAPRWTAISGEDAAVEALLAALAEEGVAGRSMQIDSPGHSPGMEPIHGWFAAELSAISPRRGTARFCSASEGRMIDPARLDARYWSRNLSQPVLFEAAAVALRDAGYDLFIEVGPRPVLTTALREIFAADEGVIAVGEWEQGEASQFPFQLAEAYVHGVDVDWTAMCRAATAGDRSGESGTSGEDLLMRRLAEVTEKEREKLLLELVQREVAAMLDRGPAAAIEPLRAFKELGFDSAAAVELRNRLRRVTGLPLTTTLAFDYPTPRAVARKLGLELGGGAGAAPRRAAGARGANVEAALRDIDELGLSDLVERGLRGR